MPVIARAAFAVRHGADGGGCANRYCRRVLLSDVASVSGKTVKVEVDTRCVHGDEPTQVAVEAKVVKRALAAVGVQRWALPAMMLDRNCHPQSLCLA